MESDRNPSKPYQPETDNMTLGLAIVLTIVVVALGAFAFTALMLGGR